MIKNIITQALQNVNIDNINELFIQKVIINKFLSEGYENIASSYKQCDIRVKNLGYSKPDIVLKENANKNKILIEVKLQQDKERGASRFQRAFIDIAYLYSEVKCNKVHAYFLYIDKKKTKYLDDKNFKEIVEKLLPIQLETTNNWIPCFNSYSEYKLFKVQINK